MSFRSLKIILILYFIVLTSFTVVEFTGKVVGITDGDTIVVLVDDTVKIKIRLVGIDCPEKTQDFGTKAKQATSDLCFGKNVRVVKTGEDRYGRTLAMVYVGNVCVNKELLRFGMAWHYKKYDQDPELAKLEDVAREKKVGLWVMANPVPPWEFRKVKK
jgi:micrococcal nuclease